MVSSQRVFTTWNMDSHLIDTNRGVWQTWNMCSINYDLWRHAKYNTYKEMVINCRRFAYENAGDHGWMYSSAYFGYSPQLAGVERPGSDRPHIIFYFKDTDIAVLFRLKFS